MLVLTGGFMDEFHAEIEAEITKTMREISAAAGRGDLNAVERDTKRAAELTAIKGQYDAIRNRVRTLQSGSESSGPLVQTSGTMRELVVHVTEGMIRQNYLPLTEHVKRGVVRIGERVSVEALPSHDRFQTEIVSNGKRLRERGRIAKFYRDAGVRVGDVVLLIEITPGQWQLVKRPK
jgi:hypothetical protein